MSVDEMAIGQPDSIVSMHKFAVNSSMRLQKGYANDRQPQSIIIAQFLDRIAKYNF